MNLPSASQQPLPSDLGEAMEFIRNVPIFSDIDGPELAKIVRVGVRKKYKKGSIILLEEETGAALFVIIGGKVKIVRTDDDGREVILSILGENDFFGEMSILDGLARSASVVAIRKADAQIKSLSLKDAAGRVANVILQLADDIGTIRKGRVEIDELPLQQDLANMAGTSRETISRVVHMFIKKGHLELQGNKLIINDYEKFKNLFI